MNKVEVKSKNGYSIFDQVKNVRFHKDENSVSFDFLDTNETYIELRNIFVSVVSKKLDVVVDICNTQFKRKYELELIPLTMSVDEFKDGSDKELYIYATFKVTKSNVEFINE
jgi:hypothetical protein